MIIKGYIFSILYVLSVILLAGILYKLGMPKKYTRKVVHILVGFEWLILYHYFGASVHTLIVCFIFLLLLLIEYRMKLLLMMSSEGENAPGTVYYAVSMTLISLISLFIGELMLPFGVAVFATSLGDGLAGVVGQSITKYNPKIWGNKTLFGSVSNFLVTFAVVMVFDSAFSLSLKPLGCLFIAILATELELLVTGGLDNITVPLGTTAFVFALLNIPEITDYILPILATPIVLSFVCKKRALTPYGTIAALVMDIAVSIAFGNLGFAILIIYFMCAIASDKYKNSRKSKVKLSNTDKTRSFMQVFANGVIPTILAIAYIFTSNDIFFIAYVAALAEALADTVASGVGSSSKNVFDPIRFKRCTPGISGGMSISGTLAALVSAVALSALSLLGGAKPLDFLLISLFAFCGTVVDSILGSLLQVKYKCKICSSVVETKEHCGEITEHYSGLTFIDNSAVNLLSTIFSALLAIVFLH